jgi:RNA polymerase sigma-70 factor (ECF subfamily)
MTISRTNQEWLSQLTAEGEEQAQAIADLRDLLLRASLFCFQRSLNDLQGFTSEEVLQRAEDCAQDALIAVLDHLSDFRGDSKFSTWAYKFAVNIALMSARHERWKGISLDELSDSWDAEFADWLSTDKATSLERAAIRQELEKVIRQVIEQDLTDKQRQVLSLIVFKEVPMDEVVQHLSSNRNSIYKLLHDARRKLKQGLLARGFSMEETFSSFEMEG